MKNSHLLKRTHVVASLVGLSAMMISSSLFAAGYSVREVSASLLGNSFAGSATSKEDISSMHFNPATISMMETNAFYAAGTGIFPHFDADNISATYPGAPTSHVSGPTETNGNGPNVFIPAAYFGWDATDDIKFAIAATVPYGLGTEYNNSWAGRLYNVDTDLESVNINPVMSYNITKEWAVAAGFEAQYIKAKLTNFSQTPYGEQYSKVEGHDWGYGYNIGTIYQITPELRAGIGYQSQIVHNIHGTTDAEIPNVVDVSGLNTNAGLTTPQSANAGLNYDINEEWSVMADVQWTDWSSFEDLSISTAGVAEPVVVDENWDDAWFYSLGATFRPDDQWTLRMGGAYDQSPVPNSTRNPGIPDSDRYWASLGASYNFTECLRFDLGYAHIWMKDSSTHLNTADAGTLDVDYKSSIDIVSAGLNFLF